METKIHIDKALERLELIGGKALTSEKIYPISVTQISPSTTCPCTSVSRRLMPL